MALDRKTIRPAATRDRRRATAFRSPAAPMIRQSPTQSLQQRLGNQGAQTLVARSIATQERTTQAPTAVECNPIHTQPQVRPIALLPPPRRPLVQLAAASGVAPACAPADRQLKISEPGDAHEREAERMADVVMRMAEPRAPETPPTSTISRGPVVQRKCTSCEDESADKLKVHRKETSGAAPRVTPDVSANISSLKGGGTPLPAATRAFFEPRFGADFSGVRVNTGGQAEKSAKSLGAKAFTVGRNIAFGTGRYSPDSNEGRRLLAHELTHVVQQNGSIQSGMLQREPDESRGVLPARPAPGANTTDQPEVDPRPQPRMTTEFFHFGTYETGYYAITNDFEVMKYEMTKLIADKGVAGSRSWIMLLIRRQGRRVEDRPRPFSAHTIGTRRPVRSAIDAMRENREDEQRSRVAPAAIPVAVRAYWEVHGEAVAYLDSFESRARDVALTVLQTSEQRAQAELAKYRLTRTEILPPDWSRDDFGQPERPYSVYSHSMSRTGPSAGLVGAAKDLKAKRDAIDSFRNRRFRLMQVSVRQMRVQTSVQARNQRQYDALTNEIEKAEGEYNVLRAVYERRYPVLAGFAGNPAAIATIAQGAGAAAQVLNEQIYQTLGNIARVRRELRPGGRAKVWKLAEIVQLTKIATQATGDSVIARMRSKVVDDKREQVLDDETFRHIVIGALALGLALLAAIPTGGSSLIAAGTALAALGSLGLNLYIASESIQDYNLEKAMTGTDFDRQQAISSEDPSLFWLAVDIAGVMLDVGPAVRATRTAMLAARTTFRTLAPLARRAISSQGPQLTESLAAIRNAARSADLGEAVVRSVERLRSGAEAQQAIGRAAGHEAAARGAALGTDALGRGATTVIGGHTVRVAPRSGALVICSQCTWVRAMFGAELAANAPLARQLERLEESARIAASGQDAAAASRIAGETRVLADELLALRRTRLSAAVRALPPQEIEEFRRLRGLRAADMAQEEIESLQRLREASGEAFQGRLAANTPDHKAERWLEYRSRGGDWTYERWSQNYQQNMLRAARSHRLVEGHRTRLGWGETQIVTTPFGPNGPRRVLDIAEEVVDPISGQRRVLRAVEHKEGYITMSDDIRAEIRADRQLVRDGADIAWHVEGRASEGLRQALAGPPPIRLTETRPTMPIAEIRGGSQ